MFWYKADTVNPFEEPARNKKWQFLRLMFWWVPGAGLSPPVQTGQLTSPYKGDHKINWKKRICLEIKAFKYWINCLFHKSLPTMISGYRFFGILEWKIAYIHTGADTGFSSGGGQIGREAPEIFFVSPLSDFCPPPESLRGGTFWLSPPWIAQAGDNSQGGDSPPPEIAQGGDSPLFPPPVSALVHTRLSSEYLLHARRRMRWL